MIEWIKAKEKLPEDDERKLVTVKNKTRTYASMAYYTPDNGWVGNIGTARVIAWADVDPYQEED